MANDEKRGKKKKRKSKRKAQQVETVVSNATSIVASPSGQAASARKRLDVSQSSTPKKKRRTDNGVAELKEHQQLTSPPSTSTKKSNLDCPSDAVDEQKQRGRPGYDFDVDDTDHCETPLQAYKDVTHLLDRIAKSVGKDRASLSIFDPYYCDGGVKAKLASMGFTNVVNRNRDFYKDISDGNIPNYDVLVTNPPYSGVHMERLLSFCANNCQKPFLLLLPHFVYTKDYYCRALQSSKGTPPPNLFFLVPVARYSYVPPSWVASTTGSKALARGKEKTAPFPSFWYCHAPKTMLPSNWLTNVYGASGAFKPKHSQRLRYANCAKDIPRDFKGEFDKTKKRPNPKARKRAAKKNASLR